MWALNALGVDEHADERAIKKAYAKLLKKTRPDENPQGFQELNDAYKAALAWRKNNPLEDAEPNEPLYSATIESSEVNTLSPTITNVESAYKQEINSHQTAEQKTTSYEETSSDFNINRFYSQCMRVACTGDSEALQYWLELHTPEAFKTAINSKGKALILHHIASSFISSWQKYNPALTNICFYTISSFFRFHSVIESELLDSLSTNLHNIWLAKHQYQLKPLETTTESVEETSSQTIITFDFQKFYQSCISVAQQEEPQALSYWLNNQQALWSLEVKSTAARYLISQLQEHQPPLNWDCYNTLISFFDLDNVSSPIDVVELSTLQSQLHGLWLFDTKRSNTVSHSQNFLIDQRLSSQLNRPFNWLQVICASFPPWRAKRWSQNLAQLFSETPLSLPETIDTKQVSYWLAISSNTRNLPKLIIAWFNWALVYPSAIFLLSLALLFLENFPLSTGFFLGCLATPVTLFSLASIYVIFNLYGHWLKLPYSALNHRYSRRFSVAWIPLLCFLSLIYSCLLGSPLAVLLAIFALFTAFYRFYHLATRKKRNTNSWTVVIVIVLAWQVVRFSIKYSATEIGVFLYFAALLVAMGLWLFDYRKQTSK